MLYTNFVGDRNLFKKHMIVGLVLLCLWTFSRLLFVSYFYGDRVSAESLFSFIVIQGLRFDIITLGLLIALPITTSVLFSFNQKLSYYWDGVVNSYYLVLFCIAIFMELATPSFIEQFDIRPNYFFVEYLKYPKEVFSMLTKAYALDLAIAAVIVPLGAYVLFRILRTAKPVGDNTWFKAIALAPLVLLLCVACARSSLGPRPANPSKLAVSNDLMVNSLALNSTYSVLYAIYYNSKEAGDVVSYGKMSRVDVVDVVKREMHVASSRFTSTQIPTLHSQQATVKRQRPLNLVIVLEESLGAEFEGSLGGLPLTPNLDELAEQGMWFEQMYATGTRSVRGIEAVITGFTPTPARSVVKLQKSQTNFFTIASLLQNQNYATSFIYGGESHFDNMRSFFMGNGFQTVIEQKDYVDPVFKAGWGVSDEDLFNKAHEYFSGMGDKPFFSLVFSSSNHTPFEYPAGRIEPYDEEFATVNNAVKYADFAVGDFIAKAKKSSYWENTLFLIVADHNSRVFGANLVPIERFHIPALILGKDIKPKKITPIASQIDLIPTLLSLMGIDSVHPAIGRDLTDPKLAALPGRALMQYNSTFAYMQGKGVADELDDTSPSESRKTGTSEMGANVVVLQRDAPAKVYSYNSLELVPTSDDAELIDTALAHALFGQYGYEDGSYRLP